MKQSSFLLKSFSLWGAILAIASIALIVGVFLFFLPRISAQNEDYSLASCSLRNGAQPGSIYYKSANLKYRSVVAESSRDKYPQGSLFRYYIEREDGLRFYLTLNLSISSQAQSASSNARRLDIKGDISFPKELKVGKYDIGTLNLVILGSSGEELTDLDFGQLKGGELNPQQYNLPSWIEQPRFIAEYGYSDSGVYGGPSFNCKLKDLIYLD